MTSRNWLYFFGALNLAGAVFAGFWPAGAVFIAAASVLYATRNDS